MIRQSKQELLNRLTVKTLEDKSTMANTVLQQPV